MIYQPAEDSYLMQKALKENIKDINLKVLEVGAGSGINLQTLKDLGVKNIQASDIDKEAVEHCKTLGFNCIQSDLFENISGKFDLILFNPPYLPYDKREPEDSQLQTTAGKKPNEIILKFLEQAKEHLEEKGKIFLITSSLAENLDFKELGYQEKQLDSEKLFMEQLIVWELIED
jgi:release factor glutamine methyltransferase